MQTTVPRAVRDALGVGPGDRLVYSIEDGEVRIRNAASIATDPFDNPFVLFTEWADELDCEAFGNL